MNSWSTRVSFFWRGGGGGGGVSDKFPSTFGRQILLDKKSKLTSSMPILLDKDRKRIEILSHFLPILSGTNFLVVDHSVMIIRL